MKSIRELFRIGIGPSSSHTMAPYNAALKFANANLSADRFKAVLYGSLAKTGRGHMTDKALRMGFGERGAEIIFDKNFTDFSHPNTMDLFAYCGGHVINTWHVISVGGGEIKIEGAENAKATESIYPHSKFDDIKNYCLTKDIRISDYVIETEGEGILDYLEEVYRTMRSSIEKGLVCDGILEGGLKVVRKAKMLYNKRHIDESAETRENRIVCAFAFAVSEQNASGGIVVTAPTCGACGVLPAVLRYMQIKRGYKDSEIVRALATAALIGNLIKTNGSISGAECGCQAEIGSACSMAAAALGELFGMGIEEIEYAAEISIEHHLGLTCDPIGGLVQIPCIERNAVAAMRAINAVSLAGFLTGSRQISLDSIITTMYETGKDISPNYKETSESGLAKLYKNVFSD